MDDVVADVGYDDVDNVGDVLALSISSFFAALITVTVLHISGLIIVLEISFCRDEPCFPEDLVDTATVDVPVDPEVEIGGDDFAWWLASNSK